MSEDKSEAELTEIPASEILDKIQKGEPVEYDHVIVRGDIDVDKIGLIRDEDGKFHISSSISIMDSIIDGFVNFKRIFIEKPINWSGTYFQKNVCV